MMLMDRHADRTSSITWAAGKGLKDTCYARVCEIRRTRRTCPANFENVRRRSLISPDKMPSEKFDIRQPFHNEMSGENSKCPRRIVGSPDILSSEAQMNFAYSGYA